MTIGRDREKSKMGRFYLVDPAQHLAPRYNILICIPVCGHQVYILPAINCLILISGSTAIKFYSHYRKREDKNIIPFLIRVNSNEAVGQK